ncbi:MAG TPA: GNAT family N-acetyltransferase [Chitinophagaceae bacterium]|jgi:N-acetylglutamate synthase-like GNAT family acetyltransferase|nr:GNAT family N-acetyltransferase [Chitinophagaceae bacterium]
MEIMEWKRDDYLISTDKSKIDVKIIHHFLSQSYWAEGIPMEIVERSIEHSLSFGMYYQRKLIGFARVISDFATFAYLADVFILPEERGKGLSKWLMQVIVDHPQLQDLRRFTLATRDAHGLYTQFGFTLFDKPERWMQKYDPDVYKKAQE